VAGFGNEADMGVVKSTVQGTVVAGELITYSLSVTNSGPSAATNVRLLDLIPAGTTVVSMTAVNADFVGEYCSLGGSCFLGTVYTNTTATVALVLRVNQDFTGTSLGNSAAVSADQQDPDSSDNISSVSTPVTTSADLSVAKSDLPDPVIVGSTLLYQIVVTNSGPSTARSVLITDTLDANVAYVGGTPGCSASGSTVVCAVGDIPAGETRSVLIEVRVDPSLSVTTILNNNVTVGSLTPDPVNNNTDSESTTANPGALVPTDLAIAKTASPATVKAGELVTYTLTVTNNGVGVAANVQVIDALPIDDASLVSVNSSQGTCNGGVTCQLGDMNVNATATITVVVRVDSDQTTPILNTARVSASNPDNNPGNNESSAGTPVTVDDSLGILKVGPAVIAPNQSIQYQIVVSNTGPSDATNVVVSDTLPAAIESAIASSSMGSCAVIGGVVTCTIARLAAGEQAIVVINGRVAANASGSLVNTAAVSSAADATGVSSTTTTPVTALADIALAVDSTPTVNGGETAIVTYTVTNNGPSAAENVVITATFPASVTAPAGWTQIGTTNVYTYYVGTVPAGTT
ncbi:MAG: DUF11 domain-containing protein, partial [Caldilineaceae bacterium]